MGQKNLTPPSIKICPLFDELKKGDFFYPPPSRIDQCLLLSNFFLEGILYLNYVTIDLVCESALLMLI